MLVPPTTTQYLGLQDTCKTALFAAQYLEDLTGAVGEITKPFPDPSNDQDLCERAEAYEKLAELLKNDTAYLNLQKLVPGPSAEAVYNNCMDKLGAYMDTIQIYAPVPDGTDGNATELPLHHGKYDGKVVTLKDMIDNLNNGGKENFVYRARLHNSKVKDSSWITEKSIHDSDNHEGDSNGIHWHMEDTGSSPFKDPQRYFFAEGSAKDWEKFAGGEPTTATQGAYNELAAALNLDA